MGLRVKGSDIRVSISVYFHTDTVSGSLCDFLFLFVTFIFTLLFYFGKRISKSPLIRSLNP